jgi:hypothetical protein
MDQLYSSSAIPTRQLEYILFVQALQNVIERQVTRWIRTQTTARSWIY